ncbi:hypothetical protein RSOLAG22IIIB_07633 [Rhizoctonia solani]|uniref:Deacetylase sirtuin-type domain-containing protein n=1 Tax=Rhizoctonia solani TaxID=456999 RepID=A0A0K6FP04_9AGAM|nr:hypothetical protein RSOLAG22IIIB_07633 [Rhizoctonia solani]
MRKLVMTPNQNVHGGVNIPKCKNPKCRGLVKTDIVFFGESLPEKFHDSLHTLPFADLAPVIGTSLTVDPFNRRDTLIVRMMWSISHHATMLFLGWREELETESLVTIPSTTTPSVLSPSVTTQFEASKGAIEDHLSKLMAKNLNLGTAKKNAETAAESTAAAIPTTQPVQSTPERKATASIRVSLAWVPQPAPIPDEESVLVLTAPTGQYVDVRIKLPLTDSSTTTSQLSETPTRDPAVIPPSSTLAWAFAGLATRTEDGKGGRWSRLVDSRTADLEADVDEGQEETLPNGDTKETCVMGGKEFIEVWRGLDIESAPAVWVSEKKGKDGGMVVRVGPWAQGVARNGDKVSVFRARLEGGKWVDVYRVGEPGVFPVVDGTLDG